MNNINKDLEFIRQKFGIQTKPETPQKPQTRLKQKQILLPYEKLPDRGIQTINGNPPSKSNCYQIVTIKHQSTLAKTPALKEYEERFYIQCHLYRNAGIKGYFEFHVDVFYPSERSDLDNSLKCALDCLQKVGAIANDNRCVKIIARKFLDKERPRIEFLIKEL